MRTWKRLAIVAMVVAVVAALAGTLSVMRGAKVHGKAAVRPMYPTGAPFYGCGQRVTQFPAQR